MAIAGLTAGVVALSPGAASASGPVQHLSLDQGNRAGGLWLEFDDSDQRDWLTRFTEPGQQPLKSTLSLEQQFNDSSLNWGAASSEYQSMQTLGFRYADTTVTGFRGQGDTLSTVFHPFNSAGSYQFHGGLRQDYDYSGAQLRYDFTPNRQIGFTRAEVRSPGLNDRTAYELSLSGRNLSLALTQVDEAGRYAGSAINLGLRLGRYGASVQHLQADNDASYSALTLETTTPKGRDIALRLEQRVNPLFDDANENRISLSYGFRFGGAPRMRADETATEGDDGTEATKKKSNTGAILAGAGAVGAALALSGGSGGGDGSDDRPRYSNQNEAARVVLNGINPESVKQNREFGGYVYRNGDGSFSSTRPLRGQTASILLPNPGEAAPAGSVTTASYHTHAGFDRRFDSENFSSQDLFSDFIFNIDGYLGTPRGQFKYHQISTGKVITLGGPGTLANAGQ